MAEEEWLDRSSLGALQRRKLGAMLQRVLQTNRFYQAKLAGVKFDARGDSLEQLGFTTRREIESDQAADPPYGSNLTFPLDQYTRMHQTSGTGGRPVRWLDTAESWAWFKECWGIIYRAAGVTKADRFLFPFSFGPFIGFWAAFESAAGMGGFTVAGGGLSTVARLKLILENGITVVGCTPTYALRMAEVAGQEGIDLAGSTVRALIVAGEPGGNIPATRERIEKAWGARVFDHTGMTEIGSLGFECTEAPGFVHLIESECIAEVIDPYSGKVLPDGMPGELVLTNLGRWGSPLVRYRTGDQVCLTREKCKCGRHFARMIGGIRGRIDEMVVIRGNNVFPAALESLLMQFPEIAEYQIEIVEAAPLTQMKIRLEAAPGAQAERLRKLVSQRLQDSLHFHAEVEMVGPDVLPRYEMKARRVVRRRSGEER